MPAGAFNAQTTPSPLTIKQFPMTAAPTPGNVGICLSGGGSRAMVAGMGQLRALASLTANGASLLSQAKALSTVSGGSWMGVPFEFLPAAQAADSVFLGPFVPDQGTLTPADLAVVPAGNAGLPVTAESFSVPDIALQAAVLFLVCRVPANMLWQTAIALHILKPLGLFTHHGNLTPADLFSYNAATLKSEVTDPNASLAAETAQLFADQTSAGRMRRPFLVCNMAMFLVEPGNAVELLAPVQATPFLTGILGTPVGKDANGLDVGGGGVTSFAFDSALVTAAASNVTVSQPRQWSIMDIVGTSSAAFADDLQNLFADWAANPKHFAQAVAVGHDKLMDWADSRLEQDIAALAKDFISAFSKLDFVIEREAAKLAILNDIIPQYGYWPVRNPTVTPSARSTRFADAGNLENAGVASLLAYSDIQGVISFINSETPLATTTFGVLDASGVYYPDSSYLVDSTIPPLFGYRPYNNKNKGYLLYTSDSMPVSDADSIFEHCQVFASEAFPQLLQGLAGAAGSGLNTNATVFPQSLVVQANPWFGVAGGQTVKVVWNYLNYAAAWNAVLQAPVQSLVAHEMVSSSFPNYKTLNTHLTPTEVNLLANLTSWAVASVEKNSGVFSNLFNSQAAAATQGGD